MTRWLGLLLVVASGCVPSKSIDEPDIPASGVDWDDVAGPEPKGDVVPYTGDDELVLQAQAAFPTGIDLHTGAIRRTCGPSGGVCHNAAEYPDLHTPANFVAAIGAPCNVEPGSEASVFDRCERTGDRFELDGASSVEIGWVDFIVPVEDDEWPIEPDMPGLHLHLADPVPEDLTDRWLDGSFFRAFVQSEGKVQDVRYFNYTSTWHVFDGGRHVVAEVRQYQLDEIQSFLASGIEQGDLNHNGVFGARPDEDDEVNGPVPLIDPGNPETSYLIARMRGHMQGEPIPGSRMPLANEPFSVSEMLALFCFVEGLEPGRDDYDLESGISYGDCSYARNPERLDGLNVEGSGTGFVERVQPMLEANCGGCHNDVSPAGGLTLASGSLYDRLLEPAEGDPMNRPLVAPEDPMGSYLYLKVIGDSSIAGARMPLDPIDGNRTLTQAQLDDLYNWINEGALPD